MNLARVAYFATSINFWFLAFWDNFVTTHPFQQGTRQWILTRVEVPEQISADQRCFRVGLKNQLRSALFQSCLALDPNELRNRRKCFLQVREGIGITESTFFGVYQLWKNHSGESLVKNSKRSNQLLRHAPWLHVTCRIVKTLKYKVLRKKVIWLRGRVELNSIFLYYFRWKCDEFWAALICTLSKKNSSETALSRADYYLQRASDLKFPGENY